MANPTTQVATTQTFFNDVMAYIGYGTPASDTFVPGEMIGLDPSTGFGTHFDDSKALVFLGQFGDPTLKIAAGDPTPVLLRYSRPRLFSMPLASGTVGRGYNVGSPVFAKDSGHVQLTTSGLSFANVVGYLVDILSAKPEDTTGATNVLISPQPWDCRTSYTGGFLTAPATGGKTYGVEVLNKTVLVPNTAAETFTLPAVANTVPGDRITFVKTNAAAFAFTLQGNASENINGANTFASGTANYAVVEVVSDGTQWYVVGKI